MASARNSKASSQLEGREGFRMAHVTHSSGTSSRPASAARAIDATQPFESLLSVTTSSTGVSPSASVATAP